MRASRDEVLFGVAELMARRGTCERAKVGCVIAREGRIVSTGYCGAPSGLPHCDEVGCELGTHGGCTRAVHAEAGAVAWAAREGRSLRGSHAYVTMSPCVPCAQLLINAGVTRVVWGIKYRDPAGLHLLLAAGIVTSIF